jgi:hypothetical protein
MEKNSLYEKLNRIRLELSKDLQKSGKNTYSKYDYFQLKDFMPRVIELCNKEGLFTKFWVGKEKVEMPTKKTIQCQFDENGVKIGETTAEEENYQYIEYAFVNVVDLKSGEEELFKKETRECQVQGAQPIQNLGSKSTYMKRYMYMDVFEIVENDAIEENTGKPVNTEPAINSRTRKPKVQEVSTKAPTPVSTPAPASTPTPVSTPQNVESTTDMTGLMTMETKLELASKIKDAGLDPREEILNIDKELGTDVPLIKEYDKEKVLKILSKKVGN